MKSKKKNKSLRHFLEYLGFLLIYHLLRLVPYSLALALASLMASICARLPFRQKIIRDNLSRAFPDCDESAVRKIIRGLYRHFFFFVVEFIHLPSMNSHEIDALVTEVEGREHLEALGGGEKPFLVLTAHMGNWELMGAYFASRIPLSVLAKPIHNPRIDRFIQNARNKAGLQVISTRQDALRPILRALKNGRCVTFLGDQDARHAGIFVNFFNKPASTFAGPALFSLRSSLPLLPAFAIRTGPRSHKIILLPPLKPSSEKKNRGQAVHELTQRHTALLEDVIRRYPEQYFWFHRCWKSSPKNRH